MLVLLVRSGSVFKNANMLELGFVSIHLRSGFVDDILEKLDSVWHVYFSDAYVGDVFVSVCYFYSVA